MKKVTTVLVVLLAFVLGCVAGPRITKLPVVHAQTTETPLICNSMYTCGQYVVQINTQRGFGRFVLYKVTDQDHIINTGDLLNVASGEQTLTFGGFEPYPRGAVPFTLNVSEQTQ